MRRVRTTGPTLQVRQALVLLVALAISLAPNIMAFAGATASMRAHKPLDIVHGAAWLDDTPDIGASNDGPPPVIGAVNLHFIGVLPVSVPQAELEWISAQPWPSTIALMPAGSSRPSLDKPPKS